MGVCLGYFKGWIGLGDRIVDTYILKSVLKWYNVGGNIYVLVRPKIMNVRRGIMERSAGKYSIFLEKSTENREVFQKKTTHQVYTCDRYDYLLSVATGTIGGLIDIFLVSAPTTNKKDRSVLLTWSDEQTDNFVMKVANKAGWNPRKGQENNPRSAIGWLERHYGVNYDHRHSGDVDDLFRMSTKDHHLKSLGHSPDIIGLFFSVLNQFTGTASFVSDGELITIQSDTQDLVGGNLVSKLFCGVVNWFMHVVSDMAGSSGAMERGSGIALPFYAMTQLLNVGKFNVGKDKQTIAEIANRAFREGYDLRHGGAMAVPVFLTELVIRFFWSLRSYFQYRFTLKESIPRLRNNPSLRTMLIVGHGTLSLIDGVDAGIKSGGNALLLLKNLNLIAWFRFVLLVLKEIGIQLDLNFSYETMAEIYEEINQEIMAQLDYMRSIDLKLYEKETKAYEEVLSFLQKDLTVAEYNRELHNIYRKMNMDLPWEADFDDFMSDSSQQLTFRSKKGGK